MTIHIGEDDGQVSFSSLINQFNPLQTKQFMATIDACHRLKNEQDFKDLVQGPLRDLVPHECAACGIGERGKLVIDYFVNVDFPDEYFTYVIAKRTSKIILNSPVAQTWADHPETTLVRGLKTMHTEMEQWSLAVQKYDIDNMIVSGLHDLSGNKTSYFCFANCNEEKENEEWMTYIVDLLTPHLHKALTTLCSNDEIPESECYDLTDREIEVLKLVGIGLTNLQIGEKLFISENTVKNHVQSIFKKLNVVNRVQAVSMAYSLRLIQEPHLAEIPA